MTILIGTEDNDRLFGGDGDDSLYGLGGSDLLRGLDGDDWLEGGDGDDNLYGAAGADTLTGGTGIDILNYGDSAAGVSVNLTTGATHGGAAEGDVLRDSFEIVRGSLFGDALTGDAGDNALRGLAGTDILFGLAGRDVLHGGDGDDVLDGGAGADRLIGGAGIDTASYADSPVGPTINLTTGVSTGGDAEGDVLSGIEIIEGSRERGISVTGDDGVNILRGLGAINSFDGLGGDDIATGADYFDSFRGGDGNDLLIGAGYNDQLMGDAGDDTIIGGTGNDNLYGDDLYDATGADRFVYTSLADTDVTTYPDFRERILDFSRTEGDVVDLGAIDADGDAANGDTAFTIVAGTTYTGAGAELLITPVGTGRSFLVRGDSDGDRRTDFLVQVFVDAPLTGADFVL
ncbi:calcium-binding protein [Inquilinus limosus]|uniref:calcium-binding protein n=1 Tax=Inquilinus limosus TaxID=171674 RepID=UPI00068B1A03|nr:calcium-binding protein [Inquilinus limosus]